MTVNTALTDTVGPYVIEDEHPKAPVYFARHKETGLEVVLKKDTPCDLLGDVNPFKLGRIMLEFEAEIQTRLSHPNICPAIGIMEHEGRLYLAMPKVGKYDLADVIKNRMPTGTKLSILEQTANALQYCHEKGIVHLDFKSTNVRTDDENTATVIDFGSARILDEPHPTVDRVFCYTERSVAPEFAQGKIFTKKTDVFSFGYMAYEILTGSEPFKHRRDKIVYEQPIHSPERMEAFGPAGELIIRALGLKQIDRPGMDELADAFKEQTAKQYRQPSVETSTPSLLSC